MQGKLSDIKSTYRTDEYILQIEDEKSATALMQIFRKIRKDENNQLRFFENEHSANDVLRYICDNKLQLLKFEKAEPTLESLFMEVVKK